MCSSSGSRTGGPAARRARRRTWYGPIHKAFLALAPDKGQALEADLTSLLDRMNVAGPGSLVVPSEYAEIMIVRR